MNINLENKVAIVTGGLKGIGKSISVKLAECGAKVYAFGRTSSEDKPENINFVECDVANFESVKTAIESVIKEAERLDILVNNAGITKDGLLMRMSEQDWDDVMSINLKGAFNTSKVASRQMMSQRSGRIINIGSIVGTTGNAGQANYAASKAGLIGLTKSLAKEFASRNILVNLVAPGYVQTEMTAKLNPDQLSKIVENIPLKRSATTDEVANTVAFFASDLSSYITGQILHVDGGMAI